MGIVVSRTLLNIQGGYMSLAMDGQDMLGGKLSSWKGSSPEKGHRPCQDLGNVYGRGMEKEGGR